MRRRFAFLGLVSTLAAGFSAYGCSGTADRTNLAGGAGGDGNGNSGTQAGGNGGDCIFCTGQGGGNPNMQQLIISPTNPVLNVIDANIQTQAFTVTTKDGKDVTGNVTWIYQRPDIGDMVSATFTPTGKVGGVGVLTAKYSGAEASTNVTVSVKTTNNSAGIGPAEIAAFDNPTLGPDPGNIVYPFDETVFPLGILSPEVQIDNVQGGVFRLKIKEKNLEYISYFNANTPLRYIIPQDSWQNIGASGTGSSSDPLKVEISRLQGGQAFMPMQQTWHIAQGKVRGAIYYWELPGVCPNGNGNGKILKIKPDSDTPEEFFFPGTCWGCHTVSRDGKTMMATLDPPFPFPQVTIDLTQTPAQIGNINTGMGLTGTFSAFNNTSDKIIVSNDNSGMDNSTKVLRIVDAANGGVLNGNAMGSGCIEPAWSPDGTKLSAICNASGGGWGFDATGGNLTIADVAADGVTVSGVKQIVSQASGQGRPAYPSFTSDSAFIAFGRPTSGSRSTGQGDLWLTSIDGSSVKQLTAASSDNQSFNPVFAPQRAGGFYWLVFISRRNYGNTLVNTNRQQLWMTAIDDPPSAADPSHPPFYIRGQEGCGLSENAYIAEEPCKENGAGCTTGADCCGGQCIKDKGTGMYICGEPMVGQCSELGNGCTTANDCCDPTALCIDGFCALKPPN